MTKLKYIILLYMSFIFISFGDLNSAFGEENLEDLDTSNVMVSFNPYVSVLDKYNRSRYGPVDLIPLIKKVATRFSKIHIELLQGDGYAQESLVVFPHAAALYNCLATTKNKVEVYLEVRLSSYDRMLTDFPFLIDLANGANTKCKGTVVSIIAPSISLNYISLDDFKKLLKQQSKFNYLLGFSMRGFDYCDLDLKFNHSNIDILLKIIYLKEDFERFSNLSCNPHNVTRNLKKPLKLITSLAGLRSKINRFYNMTRLVTKWRDLLTWPSDLYLISFAFDLYPEYDPFWSNGWWYLSKDPGNANTSEYIFEEKISVASKNDFEENPKNFQWLEQNHTFDENTTGIVTRRKSSLDPIEFEHFCRVMNLNENVKDNESEYFLQPFRKPYFLKSCLNFSVYHFPVFNKVEQFKDRLLQLSEIYSINIYTLGYMLKTQCGYAYPLTFCGRYTNKLLRRNMERDNFNSNNALTIEIYANI